MNYGEKIGEVTRYAVTFVEYGESVDGKARTLGLYATHEEAHDEMSRAAERYYNDLGLDSIKVYKDSASVGSTDECGCEYGIEKVTILIYKGEIANRKEEPCMTTSTFAPFKAIKVTCEVDWDLEDEDSPFREPKGYVPETVYTVELKADKMMEDRLMWKDDETGEYVIDTDALADSNYLSDTITDDAGFCHNGYKVLALSPDAY